MSGRSDSKCSLSFIIGNNFYSLSLRHTDQRKKEDRDFDYVKRIKSAEIRQKLLKA